MKAFHEVRNYDSDYMVWHSRYENVGFLAHWHKEIELIYVRSGSCLLSITDQTFLAHAGDLTVCESGMIHYSDSHGMDNVLDFLIFDTSILGPLFQNPGFMHPLITKAELDTFGLSGQLTDLIDTVSRELEQKKPFYQEVVSSSIQAFWALLKRCHPRTDAEQLPDDRRSRMLGDLQDLLSYIDEHYADNITLEFAASRTWSEWNGLLHSFGTPVKRSRTWPCPAASTISAPSIGCSRKSPDTRPRSSCWWRIRMYIREPITTAAPRKRNSWKMIPLPWSAISSNLPRIHPSKPLHLTKKEAPL